MYNYYELIGFESNFDGTYHHQKTVLFSSYDRSDCIDERLAMRDSGDAKGMEIRSTQTIEAPSIEVYPDMVGAI